MILSILECAFRPLHHHEGIMRNVNEVLIEESNTGLDDLCRELGLCSEMRQLARLAGVVILPIPISNSREAEGQVNQEMTGPNDGPNPYEGESCEYGEASDWCESGQDSDG